MTRTTLKAVKRFLTLTNDIGQRGERKITLARKDPLPAAAAAEPIAAPDAGELGLLRPGHEVWVGELVGHSVKVRSLHRIKLGTRTELHLLDRRRILSGAIDMCRVSRLEPLCYEATFVFDRCVEMQEANHG